MSYIAEIEHHIAGIPCIIGVTEYNVVPAWSGSPHTCPSADDYYGFTEMTFFILDRKGYRAEWLERKMTSDDHTKIEALVKDYFEQD